MPRPHSIWRSDFAAVPAAARRVARYSLQLILGDRSGLQRTAVESQAPELPRRPVAAHPAPTQSRGSGIVPHDTHRQEPRCRLAR